MVIMGFFEGKVIEVIFKCILYKKGGSRGRS